MTEAIERGVHAILLPGDLFDLEGVDADTLAFALSAFQVTGCPPVFIAPGNHDPVSNTSPYWNPRLLKARGFAWPAHVHVFTGERWSVARLPGLERVRVWGRCFTSGVPSTERPLAIESLRDVSGADSNGFDVALIHGSREDGFPPEIAKDAPFSDAEVLHAPFAYIAAGHYHAASRITATEGASAGVRLAYAGSAVAQDATELGRHGALEVRVEYERRLPFVELEFVELDRRRVHDLTVEVGGSASAERVDERVLRALADAGVTDQDLATVRLTGRIARGVRWSGLAPDLRRRAFHLRLDLRGLRPDYDVATMRAGDGATSEERFARELIRQLDQERDPMHRALIESALYYGLDAFRMHEVVPAYEELGGEVTA